MLARTYPSTLRRFPCFVNMLYALRYKKPWVHMKRTEIGITKMKKRVVEIKKKLSHSSSVKKIKLPAVNRFAKGKPQRYRV